MAFVVFPAFVLAEENLDATPRVVDCIGVGPSVRIHELDSVVHGAMRVTPRTDIIADNRSAGFDPITYYGHQCVGGSVPYGNKKCFAGLSFNTAKHPLTLDSVSPMIFSPTELALVNFDGLIGTANLNRAALQKHQHGFPAEHAPFCNRICTPAIFAVDMEGLFAAHDVVMSRITWRVRLLCWNHDPCFMDAD